MSWFERERLGLEKGKGKTVKIMTDWIDHRLLMAPCKRVLKWKFSMLNNSNSNARVEPVGRHTCIWTPRPVQHSYKFDLFKPTIDRSCRRARGGVECNGGRASGCEHGGRGKGWRLNFVTRYAFTVPVSHMHGCWCLNDEQSLCPFALLFRQQTTFDRL